MSFLEKQMAIQQGWDSWKRKNVQLDPVKQRKNKYCPKCGKQGGYVKMDFLGNSHKKKVYSVMDVSVWRCPRCGYNDEQEIRIEGKGTSGRNIGKEYGGI